MDVTLFRFVNHLAGNIQLIDEIMKFISSYAIYVFIASFILAFLFNKTRWYGGVGLASIAVGMIMNLIISTIFYRERPFITYDDVILLLEKGASASFPSDQAAISFIWAFTMLLYSRKLGIVSLFIALLVGISRIYVGHHYPFDILGGMIIAFLSIQLIKWIAEKRFYQKNQNKTALKI